jgi:hypothetical protein
MLLELEVTPNRRLEAGGMAIYMCTDTGFGVIGIESMGGESAKH